MAVEKQHTNAHIALTVSQSAQIRFPCIVFDPKKNDEQHR
jgi:hypothetical protein